MKSKIVVRIAVVLAIAFAIFLVLDHFLSVYIVSGESMEPSIKEGSIVLFQANGFTVKDKDVVILSTKKDGKVEKILKRVVGMPGETIYTHHEQLYKNGKPITLNGKTIKSDDLEITIDEDSVFVIGDNIEYSEDSRDLGTFKISSIEGKMLTKIK